MIELGEKIKAAREARSISFETISDVTKINEKYLRLIEDGDWEFLPKPYVRAFVKMFANEVGLDGKQIIREYDRLLVEKAHSLSRPAEEIDAMKKTPAEKKQIERAHLNKLFFYLKTYKTESITIGITLIILLILLIVYSQKSNEIFEDSVDAVKELPVDSLLVTQPDTTEALPEPDQILELLLRAKEEAWIAISVDDSVSHEYTFYPGDSKMWFSKERFYLRLGNAKGVELFLNGQPLKVERRNRRVIDLDIGADGATIIEN